MRQLVATRAVDLIESGLGPSPCKSQPEAYVIRDEQNFEISDPLTLWQSAAAFVTDTAVFGATGPLMGHRSRFEVAPTLGDVDYTSLVLDARRSSSRCSLASDGHGRRPVAGIRFEP